MGLKLRLRQVDWTLRMPFRVAYESIDVIETLVVELEDGVHHGVGEAAGVFYRGETAASMRVELEALEPRLPEDLTYEAVASLLPPGGARNALDCALWDLQSFRENRPVHTMLGIPRLYDLNTFFTLGLAPIEDTAAAAHAAAKAGRSCLKVKLDGRDDETRVAHVRRAAPRARLIVDANQSWTLEHLRTLAPALAVHGVELIEQPLPRGHDAALEAERCSIALAADESFETRDDLDAVALRYAAVNIKLDKAGGLSSAWALAQAARDHGLRVMVGNMCGSSLAMAPAFLLAQRADFVDLDGPLLNAADIPGGFSYDGARMTAAGAACWGHGRSREASP
jgi:L-alanine-DL-glutamate epimerase-like enolase superfamily enzyme